MHESLLHVECTLSVVHRSQGKMPASLVEGVLMDSEASVMDTFDFIGGDNVVDDDEDNLRYGKNNRKAWLV